MLLHQPFQGALRTELSSLEPGNPVAQAYALYTLAQAAQAAEPFTPTSITARPRLVPTRCGFPRYGAVRGP
ncbi:hypothetical protein H8B13_20480 [Hymenobacter sp. BT188]|uniref:hypothetical protein n=1 Tax=Hymenobacter TaxID=89966 RepID=UPI001058CCA0|nr:MULTISPECIES: hypothetical protein [Hymenobacter]MBC6609207.1 hypothetical protein [Hymenobacter sp. BT188]QIL78151.1 hypothetical protein G7064_20185 [Hymenobacter sp. HDW8]